MPSTRDSNLWLGGQCFSSRSLIQPTDSFQVGMHVQDRKKKGCPTFVHYTSSSHLPHTLQSVSSAKSLTQSTKNNNLEKAIFQTDQLPDPKQLHRCWRAGAGACLEQVCPGWSSGSSGHQYKKPKRLAGALHCWRTCKLDPPASPPCETTVSCCCP